MTYSKQLTALLVVDPYNDFISEGGKVWPRIRAVAEANGCVPHIAAGPECRAKPSVECSMRCTIDTVRRLRDLEVHCAHSEEDMEEQDLRIRHVGR